MTYEPPPTGPHIRVVLEGEHVFPSDFWVDWEIAWDLPGSGEFVSPVILGATTVGIGQTVLTFGISADLVPPSTYSLRKNIEELVPSADGVFLSSGYRGGARYAVLQRYSGFGGVPPQLSSVDVSAGSSWNVTLYYDREVELLNPVSDVDWGLTVINTSGGVNVVMPAAPAVRVGFNAVDISFTALSGTPVYIALHRLSYTPAVCHVQTRIPEFIPESLVLWATDSF